MRGVGDARAISALARLSERGLRGCAILRPSRFQQCSYSGVAGRGGGRGFGDSGACERDSDREGEEKRHGDGLSQDELNRWIERWKRGVPLKNEGIVGRALGRREPLLCNSGPWRQTLSLHDSARKFSASPDLSPGAAVEQEKLDPFSLVADEMAMLGNKLRSMVTAEVPKLAEAAEYFFKLGVEGKRFRPMVLLLMASSLTAEDNRQSTASSHQRARQQRIAEITEMIHVASLLHDDVLDHADIRRGIGSLNHIMGNKLAVLAGDFLLARASVALATLHNTEVVELLSTVLEHLVTGEIMQLTSETQKICSMDYYMRKTFYKTASLMANSCKSIAILAEQPRDVVNLAFDYGRHLGIAFQLVDDSLDFVGTKASLGKPTLSDLAQGIATAPVLFALQEHPRIYDLVNRKFTRSGDIDQALEMVQNSQGISKTRQLAAKHAQQAALAIASLPPSSSERVRLCRRALTDLTEQSPSEENFGTRFYNQFNWIAIYLARDETLARSRIANDAHPTGKVLLTEAKSGVARGVTAGLEPSAFDNERMMNRSYVSHKLPRMERRIRLILTVVFGFA